MIGTLEQARALVLHPDFAWETGDRFGSDDQAPEEPSRGFEWTVSCVYTDAIIAWYKEGQPWSWPRASPRAPRDLPSASLIDPVEGTYSAIPEISEGMIRRTAGRILGWRVVVAPVLRGTGSACVITAWVAVAFHPRQAEAALVLAQEGAERDVYTTLLDAILTAALEPLREKLA